MRSDSSAALGYGNKDIQQCAYLGRSGRRIGTTESACQLERVAWAVLDDLASDAENVSVIHYSGESFYDRPDGASPRITSIAVRKLDTGQTLSFSIHQVAERAGIAFAQIERSYDKLERMMLDAFI